MLQQEGTAVEREKGRGKGRRIHAEGKKMFEKENKRKRHTGVAQARCLWNIAREVFCTATPKKEKKKEEKRM